MIENKERWDFLCTPVNFLGFFSMCVQYLINTSLWKFATYTHHILITCDFPSAALFQPPDPIPICSATSHFLSPVFHRYSLFNDPPVSHIQPGHVVQTYKPSLGVTHPLELRPAFCVCVLVQFVHTISKTQCLFLYTAPYLYSCNFCLFYHTKQYRFFGCVFVCLFWSF